MLLHVDTSALVRGRASGRRGRLGLILGGAVLVAAASLCLAVTFDGAAVTLGIVAVVAVDAWIARRFA